MSDYNLIKRYVLGEAFHCFLNILTQMIYSKIFWVRKYSSKTAWQVMFQTQFTHNSPVAKTVLQYSPEKHFSTFKHQPYKMVKHTQAIHRPQPTNFLSVFVHFVRLKFDGLIDCNCTNVCQLNKIKWLT